MWYCAYHFAGLLFQMLSGFFLLNVCDATRKAKALQAASAFKRRKFWRETHTLRWLLIGRFIFLTREKTSFAPLMARTHLRMKICDIAVQ